MFVICPKCGAKYQIPAEITLKDGQKMKCSACEHLFVFESEKPVFKEEKHENQNESFETKLKMPPDAVLSSSDVDENTSQTMVLPEVFQPALLTPASSKKSILVPVSMVVVSLIVLFILLGLAWQYRMELQQQNSFENLKLMRVEPIRLPSETSPKSASKEVEAAVPEVIPEIDPEVINEMQEMEETEIPTSQIQPYSFRLVRHQIQTTDLGEIVQIEGVIHNEMNQELYLPEYVQATAYGMNGEILFQKSIYLTQKTIPANQELPFFGTYSPAPKEIKWLDISFPN